MAKPRNNASLHQPFAAAREHAAEFGRLGRMAMERAILCGIELIRLREAFGTNQGARRDLTSPQRAEKLDWPELVEREVGISDDTARRWMAAARAQLPGIYGQLCKGDYVESEAIEVIAEIARPEDLQKTVAAACEGKTLEQLLLPLDQTGAFDPTRLVGKAREAWCRIDALSRPWDPGLADGYGYSEEEYDTWHEDAVVMRQRVEAGEITPPRAWAGLRGRAATEGKGRAPVDHLGNIRAALTKLRHSLKHWDALPSEDRADVEAQWHALWQESLPNPWKVTGKQLEGWK